MKINKAQIKDITAAMSHIKKRYKHITRLTPIVTFKENMVQYRASGMWVKDASHLNTLCRIILESTEKFPKAAPFIVGEAIGLIPLSGDKATSELSWMSGYFTRTFEEHEEVESTLLDINIEEEAEIINMEEGFDSGVIEEDELDRLIEFAENHSSAAGVIDAVSLPEFMRMLEELKDNLEDEDDD
jgi:hypothetical protein